MVGRFLVFVGGVLVVALFAALLAPLFVDWTDFRRNFEDQASRILGKKVTVLGSVDARLLPFPSVTLHDVIVGRDSDGSPLVHVERFSMDAELAPFLSGEARIFYMRVENPRLRVRLLPDGTLDWTRGGRPAIPARTVVLENIKISGGVVEFIDEQSNRTRRISDLSADMSAGSLAGPWNVDGRAVVDGEAGRFYLSSMQPNEQTGAVPLRLRLEPDQRPFTLDLDGELAVSEGRPSYKGSFQGVWKPEAPPEGQAAATPPSVKGAFELANDRIRVPSYRLELGNSVNPYAVTGEATLDTGRAPEFLLTAEGQQIDVSRIDNGGNKGKTGRDPAASVRQRVARLLEIASSIPIPDVPGRANLSLPAVVAGDTIIRDIKLDVRPAGTGWTVENAVAILPGRTQVEAKGRLSLVGEPSFSGDLLVASTQPSGLSAWLSGNVDPAIRQLNSAGFSALVSLTPDLQRFEKLELAIGEDVLRGRVERQSFADATPNLSFDLTGSAIDLNAIRALATLFSGRDAGDSLFDHQIAARLKVGTFSAFDTQAKDVDAVFTIGEGGLSVSKLNIGNLAGAAITASGRAEGALLDYSGEGDVTLSAFDPGPFLAMLSRQLGQHPALERMVANAGWYANSNLSAHVGFGEQANGGVRATVNGTSNGSRISATYSRDDMIDLMGDSAVVLDAQIENATPSILLGQVGLTPLPFDGDGAGRVSLSLRQEGFDKPANGSLRFATEFTTVEANGRIGLAEDDFLDGSGTISVDSADLEPYLLMNGIVLPQQGAGLSVKALADVDIGRENVTVSNLSAVAGGNEISGSFELDRRAALMKGKGTLEIGTLDLPWLAETVIGPISDPAGAVLSDIPLPVIVPSGVDFAIDLKAAQFWPGILGPVSDFSAALGVKDAAISLDGAKGDWLGGRLSGQMSLANADGSGFLQAQVSIENGDLASLAGSPDEPPAAGRFNLTLAAEGSGKSSNELLGQVNGSGMLKLSGLSTAKLDLGMFDPLLAEADRLEGEISPEKVEPMVATLLEGQSSVLGDVSVPFNITGGVARAQNIVAANEAARISTDARLNLAGGDLDAAITIALQPGEEALAGADPTFRVLYRGDVTAPQRSLDIVELTNFLSLRAFERERRRVETLQANVLEKQRLRREVALYRFEQQQRELARERAEAEEKLRLEEEARLKAEQAAEAEQDAARKAAEEAARGAAEPAEPPVEPAPTPTLQDAPAQEPAPPATTQSVPQPRIMPVRPSERVTRGETLPAIQFQGLPGVN